MKTRSILFILFVLFSAKAWAQIQIHDPALSKIRHDRATIEWTTSVNALCTLEYGHTPRFGKKITDRQYAKGHKIILKNLKPASRYFFKIVAKDKRKQVSISDTYSFKTHAFTDFDQPVLKILSPPQISHLSPYKVIISWQTNNPSSSVVIYGLKQRKKPAATFSELETTTHIITLNNLMPDSRYFYRVKSRDRDGRWVQSNYASFQTQKSAPKTARPRLVNGPVIVLRRAHEIKIEFQTDRPCKSRIGWGTAPVASSHTQKEGASRFSKQHQFFLKGLKKDARYYYIVYLEDIKGQKTKSEIFAIKTDRFQ